MDVELRSFEDKASLDSAISKARRGLIAARADVITKLQYAEPLTCMPACQNVIGLVRGSSMGTPLSLAGSKPRFLAAMRCTCRREVLIPETESYRTAWA